MAILWKHGVLLARPEKIARRAGGRPRPPHCRSHRKPMALSTGRPAGPAPALPGPPAAPPALSAARRGAARLRPCGPGATLANPPVRKESP
ncbi:hypothetical protein L523_1218 [Bordetella bronchiseptica MBORD731]|nr:hypothetical protein AZ27_1295 [Bordetella bronchiseptica D756]KDD16288.1 hypothetical protein L523_1218 [Bordetella bronchiseptica MBORD731]